MLGLTEIDIDNEIEDDDDDDDDVVFLFFFHNMILVSFRHLDLDSAKTTSSH